MNKTNNKEKRGRLKLVYVFAVFVLLLAVLAVVLLVGSSRVEDSVTKMQAITDEYIIGQEAISQMRETSDYLTEECQSFVSTGDANYAVAYYTEINVTKRREASLKAIEPYGKNDPIYKSLAGALTSSYELAETESYAMRLAAAGYNIDQSVLPDDLKEVKLTEEDSALTQQQQRQKARSMVFGAAYDEKKNEIWHSVYSSIEQLLANTRSQELDSYDRAGKLINLQNVIVVIMILLALVLLVLTAATLLMPLRASADYIRKNKPLPVKGAAEYAYLAKAYNRMLETTQKHNEMLSYEATHDEMTGLYNRKFFDMKRGELADKEIALMIVDVDYFKSVNDTYGHEVGDKVLQKVSGILSSSFRSEDYVCRIGGDEFAVLMVQMHPELRYIIESKIQMVNELLKRDVDDDLPDVSLSIGVAFNEAKAANIKDGDAPSDLFNKADTALYKAKEDGRNRFAFYEDM